MISDILPACVATAETFSDAAEHDLFPAELQAIVTAMPKRRREFATVRRCARRALADLGEPPAAILPGPHGEPLWPSGVVGSMTHCAGYGAAAVGRACDLAAIGIDAEPHEPLPDGLLSFVAGAAEMRHLAGHMRARPEVHWETLAFSAKEATYKACFLLCNRWPGFKNVALTFDDATNRFKAALPEIGATDDDRVPARLTGRWQVRRNLIVTSAVVPV
jgi:enterobactin synthetase component D / holo-[acyl-carrier protein] synthase